MDRNQRKQIKRAYKKAKKQIVSRRKIPAVICLVAAIISGILNGVLQIFDNSVAAFLGDTFWELENEDTSAVYYELDFDSEEEMARCGRLLCQTVEAEGAVLLMNENDALPLAAGSKVSCFSGSSVDLVYGGTGSANIDASTADNLKSALTSAGFDVNETLWDFYDTGKGSAYARNSGGSVSTKSAQVSEVPMSAYTETVKNSVADYGDAAIVVLSRVGGEGADLEFQETNYLALDENEKDMMDFIAQQKAEGNISKIIVLINSANPLQLDFLKDNQYDVDACLWIGDVGVSGITAVGQILAGQVNPSGSLVDTYLYDNYSASAMVNFVPTAYSGYTDGIVPDDASTYMIYQEGIYVGYKYYETRYEDFVMGTGNAGDYVYRDDVAYPFGFGLSYTTFDLGDMQSSYNADTDQFELTVTVTNTGDTAGKKTVQVYAQSPYTQYDRENGVEKASVSLCGFGKTEILEPGQSQTLTIYVNKRDLASYDSYGAGTYILDEGEYYLAVAEDAHSAVNSILAAKGYTPDNTDGRMDDAGNPALVYAWTQAEFDAVTYSTSANGTQIVNQLSGADINLYEGRGDNAVTWLSRSDWEGTWPQSIVQLELTDTMIEDLQDVQYDPADYETVEMPTMGADNGLSLYDMIGLDYDDPQWEALLDQVTFDEMVSIIGDSFHWRMPVESVNAPGARDENGPQGLTDSLFQSPITQIEGTAFPSEDVMAATFHTDLMYQVGNLIGNNCLAEEVSCIYGPGNNIHRTPYGGRNFEYYSEDGFLSGKIGAAEVKGIQDKGVDVVMKHFALNDSEQNRIGLGVWVNEQAAREIYLKAFQAPIEEGNGNGVMAAYTRWGTTWSGAYYGLISGVLRGEWGSQGMSISDNVLTAYVNGVDGLLAGLSTFDAMLPYVVEQLPEYENDPVIVTAMRQAVHHNLYALANSAGMNGVGAETTVQTKTLTLLTVCRVVGMLCAIGAIPLVIRWRRAYQKWKQTQQYQAYKALSSPRSEVNE